MRRFLAAALLLGVPLAVCQADVPVRTEQLIWSLLAYNGRDYSPTFVPESSDTLFLLAGEDSFLRLIETLVYWWPITSEWKTDTDSLNIQFPGTLEIRDAKGATRKLALEEYTYFNVQGEYELNWKVVTGADARAELNKYADLYDSYFKAMQQYQLTNTAYEAELQSLAARIQRLKDQNRDYASLLERLNTLPAPVAPAAPAYYAVPPVQMQQGYIVNLPPGHYGLRLRNVDGQVLEGSQKSLVVHARRRTGGIGFELIPGDKWTRPVTSVTPSSVFYVNGSADLYVRPFFEDEFNDLSYQRTVDNAARGNPNVAAWVRIQQVPHATLEVGMPGAAATVLSEKPWSVQQSQGTSLGYTIAPWDPTGADKGKQPSLVAFLVPVDARARSLTLRAMDSKGAPLPGSERQLRVVRPFPSPWILVAAALVPLLLMIVVLVLRARLYASGGRASGAGD